MTTSINFNRRTVVDADAVTDRLWVGGDLDSHDIDHGLDQLDDLVDAGLTDIVDLRLEWSDGEWVSIAHPDLSYHWLGVDDHGDTMPDEWFEAGVVAAMTTLAHPGARVLVHCHMGINRGPSMAFAIMLALGWGEIQALEAIRQARPVANLLYAADALNWWLRRGNPEETLQDRVARARRVRSVHNWRRDHPIDVDGAIRRRRAIDDQMF